MKIDPIMIVTMKGINDPVFVFTGICINQLAWEYRNEQAFSVINVAVLVFTDICINQLAWSVALGDLTIYVWMINL